MCGVFGIIFQKERSDLGQILLEAAKRLTYRGYDSVGIATVSKDGSCELRKDVGTVEEVNAKYKFHELSGFKGIAQLRWATFGVPMQKNAQPHYDCDKDMIGAHNGNIVNTIELKKTFVQEGHTVRGDNDGEMVVHAIEKYYDEFGNMDTAIRKGAEILKGDYACVITRIDDDKMYCVKQGSSLYLGIGDGFVCASSDLPSIIPLTKRIVPLKDGEYVEFTFDRYEIRHIESGEKINRVPQVMDISAEAATKAGYPHFMLKEIYEQPERIHALLEYLKFDTNLMKYVNTLAKSRYTYLVGSGTSYHACVIGSYFFARMASKAVFPCEAGRFLENFGNTLSKEDTIVLVSQSGETKDAINILNACEGKAKILSLVNVVGSTIMMRSSLNIPLCCDLEISVPATKTFMNQILTFYYLAAKMSEESEYMEITKRLPELVKQSLELATSQIEELLQDDIDFSDMYVLGYGITHGLALEGALKIKEVVYNHCEGMYSSEFKHGPLSIVKEGYPIVFVTHDSQARMILSHINEVTCRNGLAIAVTNESSEIESNVHKVIRYPNCHAILPPFLGLPALQLFAYYLAVKMGNDPDLPRNLSKTITVD